MGITATGSVDAARKLIGLRAYMMTDEMGAYKQGYSVALYREYLGTDYGVFRLIGTFKRYFAFMPGCETGCKLNKLHAGMLLDNDIGFIFHF
jgi:hypothetical protein